MGSSSAIRRREVLARVERQGFVSSRDIALKLNVSVMTARRDVEELSRAGLLSRVRGGAARVSLVPSGRSESDFELRLAREAARQAAPGITIGLVAGPMATGLALELARIPQATFVTNSIEGFRVLSETPRAQVTEGAVVLVPGILDRNGATTGPLCVATLAGIHIEMTFVGVQGFDPGTASFSSAIDDSEVIRAFATSSRRTIGVAGSTHWTERMTAIIGSSVFDTIFTDSRPRESDEAAIAGAGTRLIVVPGEEA